MHLHHINGEFVLAADLDAPAITPWELLAYVAGECVDVTLHGRRFRVWTREATQLRELVAGWTSGYPYTDEDKEDHLLVLAEHGLHIEILDGYPDELHGATAYVHIEHGEYTGDYDSITAHLAHYAATAYNPDLAKAFLAEIAE